MRPGLLGITALAVFSAGPVWAGPAEICSNAGYRVGSAAFDMCVARFTPDDPLADLDRAMADGEAEGDRPPADFLTGLEQARGEAALVPIEPLHRDGELPASTPTPAFGSAPVNGGAGSPPSQPAPSAPPSMTMPTAPTPPTFPSFTMPSWMWSD